MKNLSLFSIYIALFLCASSCTAQENKAAENKNGIRWMSWEEANAMTGHRKIFIDVYTDWCGWCKRMEATTFQDSAVVAYMNKYYYAVKLDAERKDTIHFKDKIFVYKPEYKANELAVSLLNGQMGYPTFVLMDENFGMISPVSGYKTPQELMPVLKFVGDDVYKTKTWEEYSK